LGGEEGGREYNNLGREGGREYNILGRGGRATLR